MKTGRLNLRISEKRLAKLKIYAENREKTVTQLVEDWIDRLPSSKIDDSLSPPYEYIEGGDFRDTLNFPSFFPLCPTLREATSCLCVLCGSFSIKFMVSEVKTVSGRGIPLVGNDIDTDRIIPARYLKAVTFDGLGEGAFIDDRTALKGEHAFDQPQYQGANILIVNRNFGCGSSREHAPQAIAKWGIQALIGESFAEIFFGNCVAMGIPCLTADAVTVKQLQDLVAVNPQAAVTVNLETRRVQIGDYTAPVAIGEGTRSTFISGTWDACGQLVANADQVRVTAAKLPYVGWGNFAAS